MAIDPWSWALRELSGNLLDLEQGRDGSCCEQHSTENRQMGNADDDINARMLAPAFRSLRHGTTVEFGGKGPPEPSERGRVIVSCNFLLCDAASGGPSDIPLSFISIRPKPRPRYAHPARLIAD